MGEVMSVPQLVERVKVEEGRGNKTYEEVNWAKLSPNFRLAHNRLRQMKGLSPIPEPKIDLYVPPKAPHLQPFDPSNPEFLASVKEFHGTTLMAPGREGFTINGKMVR